jgi:hypothetical protein
LSVDDHTLKYGSWVISGVAGALCCETAEAIPRQKTARQAIIDAKTFIENLLEQHALP